MEPEGGMLEDEAIVRTYRSPDFRCFVEFREKIEYILYIYCLVTSDKCTLVGCVAQLVVLSQCVYRQLTKLSISFSNIHSRFLSACMMIMFGVDLRFLSSLWR